MQSLSFLCHEHSLSGDHFAVIRSHECKVCYFYDLSSLSGDLFAVIRSHECNVYFCATGIVYRSLLCWLAVIRSLEREAVEYWHHTVLNEHKHEIWQWRKREVTRHFVQVMLGRQHMRGDGCFLAAPPAMFIFIPPLWHCCLEYLPMFEFYIDICTGIWHVQQFILYRSHTINKTEIEPEENLEKLWTFI